MRFKRSQRIQELLLEEISKMIQHGLKDPRIGFATITQVDVTDNLKHANIYVSVMGTDKEKQDITVFDFDFDDCEEDLCTI